MWLIERKTYLGLSLFLSIMLCTAAAGQIIYVDADANGVNDGSSWADAYNYLQDAIADANTSAKPVEIHVAEGIYRPDQGAGITSGDQMATFRLISGVSLEGGYAGFGETEPNARDIELYETILSGDLAGDDVDVTDMADLPDEPSRAENGFHVVTGSGTDANAVLDGFTVTGGNARGEEYDGKIGGGIFNYSGCPTIRWCTITENTTIYSGAGMSGDGILSHCTFSRNVAGTYYGGLSCYNSVLEHCSFIGNRAGQSGGGMSTGKSILNHCVFIENWTRRDGGGICNDSHSPTLNHCVFSGNTAGHRGGGMDNYEAGPKLNYCTFIGNSAEVGGGISQHSTDAVITGCKFINNTAVYGGAFETNGFGDSRLINCAFTGNSANGGGGFYVVTGSTPELIGCTFSQNSAAYSGGGICICSNYSYSPVLTDCSFIANRAGSSGGAISNSDGAPKVVNCLFTGNSAGKKGGAVSSGQDEIDEEAGPVFLNCTLAGNKAADVGGALYAYTIETHCRPILTNCIFWDNTPQQIHALGPTPLVTYSNVAGTWPGDGNIDVDPHFAEPGYWDANGTPGDANDDSWIDGNYHLKSQAGRWDPGSAVWAIDDVTSPCIDAGDPTGPVGLEPFPNGGIINMGTYGGMTEASKSYFSEPPCEAVVAGDINGDCTVDFLDFRLMASHWMHDYGP